MAIKPLGDRVLVKPVEEKEERVGSLYVPESAKEKPQEGTVEAVGPGRHEDGKLVPLEVKVGDKVIYGKYAGTELKRDGQDMLIIRESDILAVIS